MHRRPKQKPRKKHLYLQSPWPKDTEFRKCYTNFVWKTCFSRFNIYWIFNSLPFFVDFLKIQHQIHIISSDTFQIQSFHFFFCSDVSYQRYQTLSCFLITSIWFTFHTIWCITSSEISVNRPIYISTQLNYGTWSTEEPRHWECQENVPDGVSFIDRLFTRLYPPIFSEFGTVSAELNSVYQAGLFGTLVGALYGGVINSREAYISFLEKNQATAFKSHLDAKKQLQNQFTVNFAKGGFKWGIRLGLFTTSFMWVWFEFSSIKLECFHF